MPAGLQVFDSVGGLLFDSALHKVLTFRLKVQFYRGDMVREGNYMVHRDPRIKVGMVCLPMSQGENTGGVITGIVQAGRIAVSIHDYNQRMGNTFVYTANFLGVGA